MSTNVYGPQNGPAPDFLRNTYDKQFQNLITTNFGELRPCFCKEVLPGDSVNIDPVVAIRSQPIVFPIQTRMKFYCHFFYGRNRILMKNWEDFIFKTKDGIIPPLLKLNSSRAKKMISTGSLGDNLGVPSTIADGQVVTSFSLDPRSCSVILRSKTAAAPLAQLERLHDNNIPLMTDEVDSQSVVYPTAPIDWCKLYGFRIGLLNAPLSSNSSILFSNPYEDSEPLNVSGTCYAVFADSSNNILSPIYTCGIAQYVSSDGLVRTGIEIFDFEDDNPWYKLSSFILSSSSSYYLYIISNGVPQSGTYPSFFPPINTTTHFPESFNLKRTIEGIVDATDDSVISLNKFVGDNPQIPLSSLPWRLYEFCCNYYYRNDTNNPYMLDNEPQYNNFIPSTDDGWDENEYLLHKRNWESDMFTTAVPSPQFGTAPLVGLTYNGGLTAEVTTNVTDSDGQTQTLAIKVGVDDEGNINNIFNADTAIPSGSLKALMDAMSTTGISINTLRNVNSFQRFLENVIRRGLRYRNQLLSHFGVSVDYPDIDIPQFIGGFSGDLVVRDVTNMAESAEVALGDVAGKIDAVIQSNHSINCYCAEHGFIMGIFCIVPVPTYSQVLPHMFTRYDAFDYFQKEFDKIGYVPVTYRNFLPLQAENPDEVFGYQRAWYEYMSSLDEVHGDFRLSLDDFVLYRIFKDKPTLNESFLTVDSDSLNNIFAVDKVEEKYKNSDKFLCQFYFQYSQKTMIPKHGVASLE